MSPAATARRTHAGQAGFDRADDGDTTVIEIQHHDGKDPEDHGHQRTRHGRRDALEYQHGHQADHAHERRPCMDVRAPQLLEEVALAGLDAQQLRQLAHDDDQGHPDDETLEHGLGDEAGHEAEPEHPGHCCDHADCDCEPGRVRNEVVRPCRDEPADDAGGQGRRGRHRADDEMT
jgi:hypothetical protein